MGGSKKYVLHKTNMHNVGNPIKNPPFWIGFIVILGMV
jgi:hypothetical protein